MKVIEIPIGCVLSTLDYTTRITNVVRLTSLLGINKIRLATTLPIAQSAKDFSDDGFPPYRPGSKDSVSPSCISGQAFFSMRGVLRTLAAVYGVRSVSIAIPLDPCLRITRKPGLRHQTIIVNLFIDNDSRKVRKFLMRNYYQIYLIME